MEKEKQIEEMCEVLRKNAESCKTCNWYAEGLCIGNCELAEDNQTVCETLYNAGYRKASDVAREIIKDLVDFADDKERHRRINGHGVLYIDEDDVKTVITDFIVELKKKYLENENENRS